MKGLVLAAALLTGCVAVKPTALPDGSRGYSLDCRGLLSFADCMNKAAQVCGGPYTILNQERESTLFNVAGKTMLVSCGSNR